MPGHPLLPEYPYYSPFSVFKAGTRRALQKLNEPRLYSVRAGCLINDICRRIEVFRSQLASGKIREGLMAYRKSFRPAAQHNESWPAKPVVI